MPNSTLKNFAPTYADKKDIDVDEALVKLEKLWDKAKIIAEKKFDTTDGSEYYSYVMGIWKNMVGFEGKSEASSIKMIPIKIILK